MGLTVAVDGVVIVAVIVEVTEEVLVVTAHTVVVEGMCLYSYVAILVDDIHAGAGVVGFRFYKDIIIS